jgi:outer membrane protein assembly factor BamD
MNGGRLKSFRNMVLIASLFVVFPACHHAPRKVAPVGDPELMNLSKDQAFAKAEALYAQKKWTRARRYYGHVYEAYPNDPLGRRSLLRVADTYFMQGDAVNLVEAQYKYRDFINRYPGANSADYAMLQIAKVSFKQMERPDRDQAKTREAVEKLRQMITAYPGSPYRAEADQDLQKALDRLARHEHLVARFYIRRHDYSAAIVRLNELVDTYPNYSNRAEMFYDLGRGLSLAGRKGESRLYFERVVSEFPESPFAKKARERLGAVKG